LTKASKNIEFKSISPQPISYPVYLLSKLMIKQPLFVSESGKSNIVACGSDWDKNFFLKMHEIKHNNQICKLSPFYWFFYCFNKFS